MNVIDTITADAVEVGDLVTVYDTDGVPFDTLTVDGVEDNGWTIVITGPSLIEGDTVVYSLSPDDNVDLMGA